MKKSTKAGGTAPFQRLQATGKLSVEQQQRLPALFEQTNPRRLRQQISQGVAQVWESAMQTTTPAA